VVFSASRAAIRDVAVGGELVVADGQVPAGRPAGREIARDFARTMRKLWGG
jgi:hypothetical protein